MFTMQAVVLSSDTPLKSMLRRRLWVATLALGLSLTGALSPARVGAQGLPDFTELVEKVGPAVVYVRTTERA